MKYFYKIFIAAIFFTSYLTVNAQVASNYSFAQAAGGITELTATYTQHTSGTTDVGTYTAIPIGFTFSFNCVNYTTVSISNDGYIVMGNAITNSTTPLSSGTDNNVIAALAADLQGMDATASLRSETAGTAPNRTFTVEWLHYEKFNGIDDYSFQIILYETTNTIQIKYTSATKVADNTFQVGLRGATNSDFNNRTKASNTNWIESTAGAVNTAVMTTGVNAARNPTGVFTWTFTGAICSGTPTAGTASASPATVCSGSPTTLTLTGGSTGCGISYQWQSAPAAAGPWTNIAGATTNPYSVSPTVATYYRCVTTCSNGGGSANSASVLVNMSAPTSCYCPPAATSTTYYLDDFSTTGGTTNITNNNNGTSAAGYANFTAMSATQVQGGNVNFSIGTSTSTYGFAIWIDWNQDGDFADAGERVFVTSAYSATATGSFTVPLTAIAGCTRMRVVAHFSNTAPSDPCATGHSGEYEDYTFCVTALPNCTGTPSGGTATFSTDPTCGAYGAVSVTASTAATGITYQWYSSTTGGAPWTLIPDATNAEYTPSVYGLYYRRLITCTFSGGTAYSTVSAQYNSNAPINNECDNAISLTVNADYSCAVITSGTTYCATASAQANGCFGNADDDVWFSFVATSVNHRISLTNVAGTSTDMYHSVYSGTCGSLTQINCSDADVSNIAGLTIGSTYYVRVFTYFATGNATFDICVGTPPPPPANGSCATATSLPCGTNNLAGTTVSTLDIVHGTGCSMSNYGVWYTFTGDGDQTTISSTATFDHEMAIASGACGSLTNIVCEDDGLSGGTETATFTTVSGVIYYVYISHFSDGSTTTGNFTISRTCTPVVSPPNDLCANAIDLPCGTTDLAGTTHFTSSIAHGTGCSMSNNGVWYTFTGDGQQTTITSVAASGFDHKLSISTGTCGSLSNIICNDNAGSGGTETATFTTVSGVIYYVYISHYSDGSTTTGTFTISRTCTNTSTLVGSETCEDALAICADAGSTGVDFGVTTNSPEIPAPAGQCTYLENPSWWYFQIETLGPIVMEIVSCGDVDFACYGPFDNITCDPLDLTGSGSYTWYDSGNSGSTYTGTDACNIKALASPSGNLADASYSTDDTEYININPVNVGDYYIVIIGNWANCTGNITLDQTNIGAPGAGFVDCDIVTQCDITSITANTVLTGSTYTVSGNINFADAPADGTLTICAGTICQTFNPPFTSPIAYSLSGLTADGAQHQLVATFVSGTTNCDKMANHTAPLAIGPITPIFTPVGPYCSGATIPALPTSSDNVPAITGTWSPAINNAATTTYTFTPATGQNASNANMVITITNPSNSGLTNGDYVWSGNTNSNWETASNWLVYDGTGFAVASVIPSIANNVFIRASGTCFTSSPAVNTSVVATCKNLTIDNSNTLYLNASSNLNIDGSLYNHGTIQTTGSSTIQISGNWNNSGTFSPGTGTVIFSGSSGTSTIYTGGAEIGKQFHNVIINSSSTVNLGGDVRINNDFTISITIPDIGFNCQTYTMSVGGNWARLSGLFNRGTGSVSLTGSAKDIAGEHTIFRNLDISGMYTLTAPTLTCMRTAGVGGDLNIASGASLTAQSNTINVQGNWTNSGIYNAGSETVIFNGNLVQTIISGGSSFNNVVFNNSYGNNADIEIKTPMTINGAATYTEGVVYYSGTGSLTFGNSATSNLGNATSFVNGIVSKTGASVFNFAIGEGGFWGPCAIAAPAAASTITAQYKHSAGPYNWNVAYMCSGSGLDHTSGVEHWLLTSTNSYPAVTLNWNRTDSDILDLTDLTVAHWNGNCWENMGGTASGSNIAGSITSTVPFSSYSPITFGTKTPDNPLPIDLAAFEAVCKADAKHIRWTTLTEVNNHFFILEKSMNGFDFDFVAQIQGEGNSNQIKHYNYQDNDLRSEVIYYKLSQTDFDGTTKVFPMIAVDCSQESEISIVPNPFKSTIQISGLSTDCLIDIYGARGEKIQSIKHQHSSMLEINLEHLSVGIYFVRIIDAKGMSKNFKIIKT